MRRDEICLRDPYVVLLGDVYYMYGTDGHLTFSGKPARGFPLYTSRDLENWEGPRFPFLASDHFWGKTDFWAPEMHQYQGSYYLFASFIAPGRMRGTQILKADRPEGPFQPISQGPATPSDWMCLDGTLVLNQDGAPHLVFCHEWVQAGDGEICALPLSEDLSAPIGEPQLLFRASEAPWVKAYDTGKYVTDGPFAYRTQDGQLLLLWSSFSEGGYTIGCARSANGFIQGPWTQDRQPLYADDGGHGMVFRKKDGSLCLTIHSPNESTKERPIFLPVIEEIGSLRVVK